MKNIFLVLCTLFLYSCTSKNTTDFHSLLKEWQGKEIIFPSNSYFTTYGKDSIKKNIDTSYFKIVSYIDSVGCMSCKLKLDKWLSLISEFDSISSHKIPILFYFYPKDEKMLYFTLKKYHFNYPVCIDRENLFNKTNNFPTDMRFQTFLLDNKNKVVAIGNPIYNSYIKEIYLKVIRGEQIHPNNEDKTDRTNIHIDKTSISLNVFPWKEEQKVTFHLKNVGNKPLVIEDVNTSCGCTSVNYSKKPVSPGDSVQLIITYKAEQPEYFNKAVTVYCNAKTSPIILQVTGNAI